MLWGFLGFWMVLGMILGVVRQRGIGVDIRGSGLVDIGNRGWEERENYGWKIDEERREAVWRKGPEPRVTRWESGVDAEATLRLFDEL